MAQTFAQYLINKIIPDDITKVTKPLDKSTLDKILRDVYNKHPDKYDEVVSDLKRLGDTFSTYEGITYGLKELVPINKPLRDRLLNEGEKKFNAAKTDTERLSILGNLQNKMVEIDSKGDDSASLLIQSGAMSGKKTQLTKLRTTPVAVGDAEGKVSQVLFKNSYAEGQDPLHHWLQNVDSRYLVAQGKIATAAPGELSKVITNILRSSVVSSDDCGTHHGILLPIETDVVGRYLAEGISPIAEYNAHITEDLIKKLRDYGVKQVLVRSPQTCESPNTTVCSHCMGDSMRTGKLYSIGENAGIVTAGAMSEPLTQMTLSSKHGAVMAGKVDLVKGEKGFRQIVEMPKQYPNRKIFCEMYGKITQIINAPQGGKNIIVQATKSVPSRFIVIATPVENHHGYWNYYIPTSINVLKEIKVGLNVIPGMELTTGIVNLQDIARLKGLGITRSTAAQEVSDVYKNTGVNMDRRHFELLSRSGYNYVKMDEVPSEFKFHRGEVVAYNDFKSAVELLPKEDMALSLAEGYTLAETINDVTPGTYITEDIINYLKQYKVSSVKAVKNLQVEAIAAPLTRTPNLSEDWLATLNHRYLKDAIVNAATTKQVSDIHGYNPVNAYAYGAELNTKSDSNKGKY